MAKLTRVKTIREGNDKFIRKSRLVEEKGFPREDLPKLMLSLEAQTLERLEGLAVPRLLESTDLEAVVPFIDVEYLPGNDLHRVFSSGRCFKFDERNVYFFADAAFVLGKIHERGVVHRDVKPGNILCVEENSITRPYFIDFGISNIGSVLSPMKIAGTPVVMAPEQTRSYYISDARSDIYSFGVVLYRAFSGSYPFMYKSEGISIKTLMDKYIDAHRNNIPARMVGRVSRKLSSLDSFLELDRIVMKCLEKDPEDRYQNAKDLYGDLRAVGEQGISFGGLV